MTDDDTFFYTVIPVLGVRVVLRQPNFVEKFTTLRVIRMDSPVLIDLYLKSFEHDLY